MRISTSNRTTTKQIEVNYHCIHIEDDPTGIEMRFQIPRQHIEQSEIIGDLVEQFIQNVGAELATMKDRT